MAALFSDLSPTFIDTATVATMLDQTVEHFLRLRSELEDVHGFPVPMPHWRRPLKWRRDQVQGWIAAQGRPHADAPARPVGHNIILLEEARRA